MAISIISTIAKLAILLLIIILPCVLVLPSRASRIVDGPQWLKSVDDHAPINVRNQQNLASLPKKGTGGVVMKSRTFNNNTASTQQDCNDTCNNNKCAYYYPNMCHNQDPASCYVGCSCADYACYCLCDQ